MAIAGTFEMKYFTGIHATIMLDNMLDGYILHMYTRQQQYNEQRQPLTLNNKNNMQIHILGYRIN